MTTYLTRPSPVPVLSTLPPLDGNVVLVQPPTRAWSTAYGSPWHWYKGNDYSGRNLYICKVCGTKERWPDRDISGMRGTHPSAALAGPHFQGCAVRAYYETTEIHPCRECRGPIVLTSDHRTACDEVYRLVARQTAGTLTTEDSRIVGMSELQATQLMLRARKHWLQTHPETT